MSEMKEMCEQMGIEVTEDQLVAGRYLESRGQKFCGHFGYENAIDKADELFLKECEEVLQSQGAPLRLRAGAWRNVVSSGIH